MDVVVKEGYISYKGKLYHAGEVAHLPKTAAQKLFGAGLVEAPANKTMEEIDSPADSSPEEEEESGEELPAPDSKGDGTKMSAFKDMVAADNKDVFLNMDEFGEKHNLNGADCQCILQNSAAVQALSIGEGMHKTYPELYGDDLVVNVEAGELPEIPVYGQLFSVDDKNYLVDTVKEDMGMLTIGLVANER